MSQDANMDAQQIIDFIATAPKKTPVRVLVAKRDASTCFSAAGVAAAEKAVEAGDLHVFDCGASAIVTGDWTAAKALLDARADAIADTVVETVGRNTGVPMLDVRDIHARIEPGAYIRDHVSIGDGAVIMMGAVINVGAEIGDSTMIDMGAILGGRAIVGKNCHIGAGTVLAGVVEPASATPVRVDDGVLIGANAVVLEGVHVGEGAVVAAGAVVVDDVAAGAVVAGVPARVIKQASEVAAGKVSLVDALRSL